ncbi:hypothetical protein BDF19DRAFT_452885 [Syncephalis fuscata]|nr:hypothetical protein BDF19DRAFT_452885 [Syncephalis fuscata]
MKAKLKLAMSKQQLRQAFEEAVEHIFEIPSVSDEERTTVCAYKSNWSISWIRMVLYCCEENRWDLISLLIDHLISPEAQTESCSSALPICFKQLFDEYSLFPSDVTFNVIRRPIIKLDSEVVLGNWIIETKTPENTTEHVLKAFSCSLTGQREIALHKYICSQSDIFEYVPQIVTVGEVLSMPALVTNYVTKQETMLYSNKEQMKLTQDLIKVTATSYSCHFVNCASIGRCSVCCMKITLK